MAFVLQPETAERWETIDLGEAGAFEVRVRKPTWGDMLADSEAFTGYAERRMQVAIAEWRGLVDERGAAVPFSHAALVRLCEASPAVFQRLAALASRLFFSVGETERKNSVPPSSASTAGTPAEPDGTPASSAC